MLKVSAYNIIELMRLICICLLPGSIIINESSFTNIILWIAVVICIFNFNKEKNKWLNFNKHFLYIILFFCAGLIISNYFSLADTSDSMKWARRYCYWILPGIAIYGLWEKNKYCKIFFAIGLFWGCFMLCLYAGYENLILNIVRPKSLTASPNSWPAFLVMLLPFLLYGLPSKLLKLLTVFFITYGVLLSQSRTSFIALLLVFIMYFTVNMKTLKINFSFKRVFLFILLILIIISGIFYIKTDNKNIHDITNRMISLESYDIEKQGGDRIYLWNSSIEMFIDRPIHGVGLRNFNQFYISCNYMSSNAKEPDLQSPHNIFLHYLVEMGLVGTIPLIVLLFYVFVFTLENINNNISKAMLISVTAILCNNMFDYQLIGKYYYQLFWVLFFVNIADIYFERSAKIGVN